MLDKVVTVFAPAELRIERILARDPFRSREEIEGIITRQMDEGEKMKRADFVIYNDESRMVIPQVLELHNLFLESSQG